MRENHVTQPRIKFDVSTTKDFYYSVFDAERIRRAKDSGDRCLRQGEDL
jgi:hypothetical protein